MEVEMIKSSYSWGEHPADGGMGQIAGNGEAAPIFETERAISAARLQEKYELDARFAKIIEMIRETRQLIERTIAQEFEQPNVNDQSTLGQ
jgi:hypothetical protein